jgi:hypothetical protein
VSELRRALLDLDVGVPELPDELRFLAARQAALGPLLLHHAELYRELCERIEREGSSEDTAAVALEAAGDLATLMQTLRRREDLLSVLAESPVTEALPGVLIDQLIHSFAILACPEAEDQLPAAATPIHLDRLMGSRPMRAWLKGIEPNPALLEELGS